jgi:hypothetical protein
MLLAARGVLPERALSGSLSAGGEQAIRAIAALVGSEIVALVEVFTIDARERHEFDDVDHARRLSLERLQLFALRITYWSFANS